MEFLFAHTRIGFCWWDLLALLILIAVIVVFIVKIHKQKKIEKELQDEIDELTAGQEVPEPEAADSIVNSEQQ